MTDAVLPKKIIVCIPAFNEANNIGDIVDKVKKYSTEIVVCDDGSNDDTAAVAQRAGATVVKHGHNKGYGSAIKTLFAVAKERDADIMVTLDSDGQHDPDELPRIIEPILSDGTDVVIGSRFLSENSKQKVPMYRAVGIKTITRFTKVISYENITDAQSGFRAYSKKALSRLELLEEGMSVSTEILFRAREQGLSITEVPVTIRYDVEDASTHNPLSHGFGVLSTVLRFISLRHSLAFYGIPGIIFLVIAGGFMAYALNLFSETRYVSTNIILVSMGTAVIGVMFLLTGIILSTFTALLRETLRR